MKSVKQQIKKPNWVQFDGRVSRQVWRQVNVHLLMGADEQIYWQVWLPAMEQVNEQLVKQLKEQLNGTG